MAGCGTPSGEFSLPHLAADAPAREGLPIRRAPEAPSPVREKAPFGLYAAAPDDETLSALAFGPISPDGRFRSAMTTGGAWVVRIDAAWFWQIMLPAAPKESTLPATPPPPPPTAPLVPVAPLVWTEQSTLLFQNNAGHWLEANPLTATVTALPAVFHGKENLKLSPDGKRVLFQSPGKTGKQLWVAAIDGSGAKMLGENLIGLWVAGKQEPVVENSSPVNLRKRMPGEEGEANARRSHLDR